MATLSNAPRITTATLASATAGPFNVGFRIFDPEAIAVTVNGGARTDFTFSGSFSGGYCDTATITFLAPLAIDDVLVIEGAMEASRDADVTGTGTVRQLNIELPRLWAAIADWKRPIATLVSSVSSAVAAAVNAAASAVAAQTAETNAETAEANAEAWAGTVNSTFLQRSDIVTTITSFSGGLVLLSTNGSLLANTTGRRFRIRPTASMAAASGALTLQTDSAPAAPLKTILGANLHAGYFIEGADTDVTFDGTNWVVGVATYSGAIGPLATTSGASVDFTGIPAWATEVEIVLDGVSGTSGNLNVQLGSSGGVENTGYLNHTSHVTSSATAVSSNTSAFTLTFVIAADAARGVLTLKRFSPSENLWILSGSATTGSGAGAAVQTASGAKTLAAQLDRVRIASSSGTLDAGRATVTYR